MLWPKHVHHWLQPTKKPPHSVFTAAERFALTDHYLLGLGVIYLLLWPRLRSTDFYSQHKTTSLIVLAETNPPFTAVANTDLYWQWLKLVYHCS